MLIGAGATPGFGLGGAGVGDGAVRGVIAGAAVCGEVAGVVARGPALLGAEACGAAKAGASSTARTTLRVHERIFISPSGLHNSVSWTATAMDLCPLVPQPTLSIHKSSSRMAGHFA